MPPPIEQTRLKFSRNTVPEKKSSLGQFLTPAKTAAFMAELFLDKGITNCRLLDPGAGIGSLSSAFLDRCISKKFRYQSLQVTAYEIDETLCEELDQTLEFYKGKLPLSSTIIQDDFIEHSVNLLQSTPQIDFTHAILNPPYKKINSNSLHRKLLRKVGIETVNLYTAFLALTLKLMAPGGQVVAIIPRSFCNGTYFRPFRKLMMENAAIRHLHLFESRNKAFKDDKVLQENIIIMLEKKGRQSSVTVSTSTDDEYEDLFVHQYSFDRIVTPDDPEAFIHIPTSPDSNGIENFGELQYSINDLEINISTGPVVDFRVKEYLSKMPENDTVPLLYPSHFVGLNIEWPKEDFKKWNAIRKNAATEKWLFPTGFYCVVRRFSSKEEKRRVIPGFVNPRYLPDTQQIGFENHLNVFHTKKQGLPEELALGLSVYLSTTAIDEYFRRFSGHTQVNATDLKTLKYPSRDALIGLGRWARIKGNLTQEMIDQKLESLGT